MNNDVGDDNGGDRGASGVERLTDSHNIQQPAPTPEVNSEERRLDNWQALFILFTVAMLPAYVQPAQLQLET